MRGEVERRLIEDSSELDTRVGDRLGDSDDYLLEQITAPVARRWHTPNKEITSVPEYPKESGKELADSARRGRHLFYTEMAGCAKCHGDPPLDDELANDYDDWTKELNPGKLSKDKLAEYIALGALPPRILQPRVLRDGAIRGGEEPEDIFRRIVNGIDGTPMPAAIIEAQGTTDSPGLSDRDIWDLVNYVRDLPNQPVGPPEKKP